MFKKISVFLVLVLVVGALSACAGSMPKLSEEKKAEIEDAWYAQYEWTWHDEGGRCRYYGTYEGYDLIFHQMGDIFLDVVGTITIAGIKFPSGNPFNFYGYRDGKIYEVAELYESGELSKESIAAAAEIHNSEEKTLPLSDEEKKMIQRAWAKHYRGLAWNDKADQVYDARYYGNLEGYDILYVVVAVPPDCASYREYTIGESKFEDDCSGNIYGYKDGTLTFVTDLYNEGELSEDAISEIANVHQRYESKETK